ncbi:MAG: TonB-dependent receptor, partial [Gemmatimonadetes bacterium]|nr:TonB-dependent receptor [Gemmatimonadota bacterium]
GENFDWIYYPKVSASWVLSEEPAIAGVFHAVRISNFKFRAAYGQAGQAPTPFAATQTYTVDKVVLSDGTITSALRARSLGNPDLVAERGEEIEVGFDAGIFDERIGLEFTYYDKQMENVIIPTPAPGSTGFGGTFFGFASTVFKNLGTTRNSGVELGFNATPVQTRPVTWDTRLSLTTNRNRMVTFGDARLKEPISGQSYGSVQEHRVGYPLGGYWVPRPKRKDDGSLVLTKAGVAVLDTAVYVGPSIPTREVAFSNTFTLFRDFQLYSLFDYKGGHYLYNYKEYARCTIAAQMTCARMNDATLANDPEMPYWRTSYAYVEKADFVKLRDLSLTYSMPAAWARRFQATSASMTLAGHNLGLWSDYSGMDPEVNGYGNRSFARSDVYPVPMMRRVSASLNFTF